MTTLQKVVALIFQCALVFDIQATLYSFFISQLGSMLQETEVADFTSVKPWLINDHRCLHNVISCVLWFCGLATAIAGVAGVGGLIIGLLLYVWSERITVFSGIFIAMALLSLAVVALCFFAFCFCLAGVLTNLEKKARELESAQELEKRGGQTVTPATYLCR
jgi:hypothetical protein